MDAGLPKLQVSDATAWIMFDRPQHKNRLEQDDLDALHVMLRQLATERDVRVVVLTGRGDVFSSGFNINGFATSGPGNALDGPGGIGAVADALEAIPQPTIARLNGSVYGGATDLALACDFRVGITGMQAVMPAARLGLHYYKSGIVRYATRLGVDHAKRMFLTGEPVDAEELLRIGYLTQLVATDDLDEAVGALVHRLKRNAPMAVQGVKLALNALATGKWDEGVFLARAEAALNSRDLQEGINAYHEKRTPVFRNE